MTTNDASIETRYRDVFAPSDDHDLKEIVGVLDRDLTRAYVVETPPAVRATIERIVEERGQALRSRQGAAGRSFMGRLVAWWQRLWRTRRVAALALAAAITLGTAGCIGYASHQIIRVFLPEQGMPAGEANDVTALPVMPFPWFQRYRAIDPARAARESGLPVAYFSAVPSDLRGDVGTVIYEQKPWLKTEGQVVLRMHSLVRYRGSGHTVLLELSEPSPPVVAKYRILLGEHTIHLANGTPAWTSVEIQSYEPNELSFVWGQYIVTLASDLPFDRVEELASTVTVSPEASNPAQRGIPPTWPTPLPAETAVPSVDIQVAGSAEHYVSAHGKPGLRYHFDIGNRGFGHEADEDVTLLLPSGIAFVDHTPRDHYTIHFGGSNGSIFGTEDLVVTDDSAFDKGLTVRVTWREQGVVKERAFQFPIVAGPAPTPFPVSAGK